MDDGSDDALAVATVAARAADEKQGRNIVVLDVGRILAIAELFVVLDVPNRRLVRTLVDEIEQAVRAATGRSPRRVEGVREQQWVLLDYGDVVVHVFLDEIRRYYEIERLYRDAPLSSGRADRQSGKEQGAGLAALALLGASRERPRRRRGHRSGGRRAVAVPDGSDRTTDVGDGRRAPPSIVSLCDDRAVALPHRPLGGSGIDVSIMSLGSWRTYERLSRDEGIAVMRVAREAGIDFLDDARYDDESGTAPIPTGWSEVVFGELFRASGWRRDDVTIANKLWWEHWPDEDAAGELDGSLGRMGLDHVDLIYAIVPPPTLPVAAVVEQVAGLIASGRARAWGTGMWSGEALAAAIDVCDATGAPRPVAAEMGCSLAEHRQASDPRIRAALDRGPIGLVAAHVLAGGTLTRQVPRPSRPARKSRRGRQLRRAAGQGDRGSARRARHGLGCGDCAPCAGVRPRPSQPGEHRVRSDQPRAGARQRRRRGGLRVARREPARHHRLPRLQGVTANAARWGGLSGPPTRGGAEGN